MRGVVKTRWGGINIEQAAPRERTFNTRAAEAKGVGHQVCDALERLVEHAAGRITVAVQDGTVTLSGTVRSWAEGRRVLEAARSIPGIRAVDSRLRINPNF